MKLQINGDKVPYLFKAGKDMVKSTMDVDVAERIVTHGDVTESKEHPGYPLCVNGEWFFPGVKEKKAKKKSQEE